MKNFVLGGLVTYLFAYSLGCTYFLMKGARKNVRSY